MHKVKRIIRRALLPRVNENIFMEASGKIATTEIVSISNDVYEYLDANMVTRLGQRQISAREVIISNDQPILTDDRLSVRVEITPITSSDKLTIEEGVMLNT